MQIIIFQGPQGSGKSELIRKIASEKNSIYVPTIYAITKDLPITNRTLFVVVDSFEGIENDKVKLLELAAMDSIDSSYSGSVFNPVILVESTVEIECKRNKNINIVNVPVRPVEVKPVVDIAAKQREYNSMFKLSKSKFVPMTELPEISLRTNVLERETLSHLEKLMVYFSTSRLTEDFKYAILNALNEAREAQYDEVVALYQPPVNIEYEPITELPDLAICQQNLMEGTANEMEKTLAYLHEMNIPQKAIHHMMLAIANEICSAMYTTYVGMAKGLVEVAKEYQDLEREVSKAQAGKDFHLVEAGKIVGVHFGYL